MALHRSAEIIRAQVKLVAPELTQEDLDGVPNAYLESMYLNFETQMDSLVSTLEVAFQRMMSVKPRTVSERDSLKKNWLPLIAVGESHAHSRNVNEFTPMLFAIRAHAVFVRNERNDGVAILKQNQILPVELTRRLDALTLNMFKSGRFTHEENESLRGYLTVMKSLFNVSPYVGDIAPANDRLIAVDKIGLDTAGWMTLTEGYRNMFDENYRLAQQKGVLFA